MVCFECLKVMANKIAYHVKSVVNLTAAQHKHFFKDLEDLVRMSQGREVVKPWMAMQIESNMIRYDKKW